MTKIELFEFDAKMRSLHGVLVGVDEAGRGPLAGDVFAAAVILPPDFVSDGLDDSKKVPKNRREKLFEEITKKAVAYCIKTASVAEIEEINILKAALLAMRRAIDGLKHEFDMILVDGDKIPGSMYAEISVIKGDSVSASIAAASILAKVARDEYMSKIAHEYPQYGFEKHKGYGTKFHYEMLEKHGVTPVHRKSFLKKILN